MSASERTRLIRSLLVFTGSNKGVRDSSVRTAAVTGAILASELGCCGPPPITGPPYYVVSGYTQDPNPFDLSGDFTIEWFQTLTSDENFPRVFSFGASNDPDGIAFAVSLEGGTAYVWIAGTPYSNFSYTMDDILNTQVHFALVRNAGDIQLYLNGESLGASLTYTDPITVGPQPFTIQNESIPGPDGQFYGTISSFRWSSTAIYTGPFTPPTAPLTALPDTVLLITTLPPSGSITASGFTVTHYSGTWSPGDSDD
jgi:hypothetical protein